MYFLSLRHIKERVVESTIIAFLSLDFFEDEVKVSHEVVEVDTLVVLNSIGIEEESFDSLEALLVASIVILFIDTFVKLGKNLLLRRNWAHGSETLSGEDSFRARLASGDAEIWLWSSLPNRKLKV